LVQGLRDDGSGKWDDLVVPWENSGGIALDTPAPTARTVRTFTPSSPGVGVISVSYGLTGQPLHDTHPAELMATAQIGRTADGLVLTFTSSKIDAIKIRIIDVGGSFVVDISSKDLQKCGNKRFIWDFKNGKVNKRMGAGEYLVEVFRDGRQMKIVPFVKR
jgi:hypothetical protein